MKQKILTRFPIAQDFYTGDCKSQIRDFIAGFKISQKFPKELIGAIVPHAGWRYSGQTAARTLYCLSKRSKPEVCVILGSDHSGVNKHNILPIGVWDTPLGVIPIAEKVCETIIQTLPQLTVVDINAHNREHSIEVIAPMVRYFFPDIKLVPIIVKSELSSLELGKKIAIIIQNLGISMIFLASSDLTHYGEIYGFIPGGAGETGFQWMRSNDLRIIKFMESCNGQEVLTEAKKSLSACGSGAVAALLEIVLNQRKKQGFLVEYTTSHGNVPAAEFTYGVGYAGVVY
ncbi:MAG: AmmeMemoRadiSam system protein B [Candidatus Neomarinimicrobiota bacterium]